MPGAVLLSINEPDPFFLFGLALGARDPFCPACNSWKHDRQVGTWAEDQRGKILAILRMGDLADLPPPLPGGPLVLNVASCLNCRSNVPIVVSLEMVKKTDEGKANNEQLVLFSYPGEALDVLEALMLGSPLPPPGSLINDPAT